MRNVISIIILAVALAQPAQAGAGTYSVSTGLKGVVDMYDLSSVTRTERGFTIRNVAISDHWPKSFGPIAYRVSREDYDCGTGRYDIAEVQDFDRDGKLLSESRTRDHGEMVLVAGTSSGEIYNRFCEPSRRGVQVTGLAPRDQVDRDTPHGAYLYGRDLLAADRP